MGVADLLKSKSVKEGEAPRWPSKIDFKLNRDAQPIRCSKYINMFINICPKLYRISWCLITWSEKLAYSLHRS